MNTTTETARIYVGTYAKYNSGSIAGEWVDISQFSDADEFLQHCNEIHSDEEDPELMFQDYEGFPKCFYSESPDTDTLEKLFDFLNMDEDDRKLLEMYADATGKSVDDLDLSDANYKFHGMADSGAEFAERIAIELGDIPKNLPSWIESAIDWQRAWNSTLSYDYDTATDENGTIYFFLNN